MSKPLDYFEPTVSTTPPPANRRFLGYVYWAGLTLMNGLLGNVWWNKWDHWMWTLQSTGLYLIFSWQVVYIAHLLMLYLFFTSSQAIIRTIPRFCTFHWSEGFKGLFSTVKLGLLSQTLILFYLLVMIFGSSPL